MFLCKHLTNRPNTKESCNHRNILVFLATRLKFPLFYLYEKILSCQPNLGFHFFTQFEIIIIHHECPCRIEIPYPRGWNFSQGQGLQSPWLNSNPEGEISLSYINMLMVDCFSPTFSKLFIRPKSP